MSRMFTKICFNDATHGRLFYLEAGTLTGRGVTLLGDRIEVIRREGAPALITVPLGAEGGSSSIGGFRPDQQTFRHNRNLAIGAIVNWLFSFHLPPNHRLTCLLAAAHSGVLERSVYPTLRFD